MKIYRLFLFLCYIFYPNTDSQLYKVKPGLYKSENPNDFFSAEITLKQNGTFSYRGSWGLFNFVSSGDWLVSDEVIIFKSNLQNLDSVEVIVSEDYLPNKSKISVYIRNSEMEELRGITKFNNNDSLICTFEECFFSQEEELMFLDVMYFEYTSQVYYIKNKNSNFFDIIMPGVIDTGGKYEVFRDTAQVIKPDMFKLRNNEYILVEE